MNYILSYLLLISIFVLNESCQQSIAENSNTVIPVESENSLKGTVEIIKKYELPTALNEISGMVWLTENTFACVQDEEGIIFIYDILKAEILNEINFADKGDYEGLAINGKTAYVQRADGEIFVVNDFLDSNPTIKQFKTGLTSKQNIEGIAYDKNNNRLISVIKDKEPGKVDYKGVYAIELKSFKSSKEPVFKIPAEDNRYKNGGLKKSTFYPSGVSVYEPNGHLFIVDGRQAGLLEMNTAGVILNIYNLDNKNFSQPESITFDNKGNIFIGSEAGKEKAHITQIKISK